MVKYKTYWSFRTIWPSEFSGEAIVLEPTYLYKTKSETLDHIRGLQEDYERWRTYKFEVIKILVPVTNPKNFKTIKYKENKNENN